MNRDFKKAKRTLLDLQHMLTTLAAGKKEKLEK